MVSYAASFLLRLGIFMHALTSAFSRHHQQLCTHICTFPPTKHSYIHGLSNNPENVQLDINPIQYEPTYGAGVFLDVGYSVATAVLFLSLINNYIIIWWIKSKWESPYSVHARVREGSCTIPYVLYRHAILGKVAYMYAQPFLKCFIFTNITNEFWTHKADITKAHIVYKLAYFNSKWVCTVAAKVHPHCGMPISGNDSWNSEYILIIPGGEVPGWTDSITAEADDSYHTCTLSEHPSSVKVEAGRRWGWW